MEDNIEDDDVMPSVEDIRTSARRLLQQDPKEVCHSQRRNNSRKYSMSSSSFSYDNYRDTTTNDGQGIGYTIVLLSIIGFIFSFIFPPITILCNIIIIILALCGCCCLLQPNTKRWASFIIFTSKLQSITIIIGYIILYRAYQKEEEDAIINNSGVLITVIISWILNLFTIVFACLYTWEREENNGCCSCKVLFDNIFLNNNNIDDDSKDILSLTA